MLGPINWSLCDLEQTELRDLSARRPGGTVSIIRKDIRTSQLPISLEDPAAELATSTDTVLKATIPQWTDPLFLGRILIPETKDSASDGLLTLHASDPLATLTRKHYRNKQTISSSPPFFIAGSGETAQAVVPPFDLTFGPNFSATDESSMLWSLINSVGGHGIIIGTLADGVDRTLAYAPGKEIAEAINEITDSEGGLDFELNPVEGTDGRLVELNTYYPRQGSDKSDSIIFDYRHGDRNAKEFELAPERPVNSVLVVGGVIGTYSATATLYPDHAVPSDPNFPISIGYRAWHQDSIDQYGVHEDVVFLSDVTNAPYLQAKAIGLVAAAVEPVPFFDFTPTPASQEEGSGREFGPDLDFWMGDTIAVEAHLPAQDPGETTVVEGRVNEAILTENENGEVDLDLNCAPEQGSGGVSSELTYFVGAGA